MHPLTRLAGPLVLASVGAVFALALFAGAVRAMPWLVDPLVPSGVIWPFARELGRVGLEVSLLVGIPIGTAAAVSVFVARGEARALLALGQSPLRMASSVAVPAGAGALLGAALALAPRPDSGRFATELLDRGREACGGPGVEAPQAVQVPVVGVSWLCFPGRAPVVVGAAPGLGAGARFVASSIRASSHLEQLTLDDFRIAVPRRGGAPAIALRAGRATVRGLVPWATPGAAAQKARSLAVALGEWLFALALTRQLIATGISGRALPVLAGALGGGGLLAILRLLDRVPGGEAAYPLFPAIVVGVAWLLVGALALAVRLGSHVAGALAR